jgi:hypothetical protein
MADSNNQLGVDAPTSVSALGLRWAALRGMLGSPLIEAEEQRALRDDLLRELQVIERDFASVPARNPTEISAKIDVAKSVLRQGGLDAEGWLASLLDSVQADVRTMGQTTSSPRFERSPVNLSRATPTRPDQGTTNLDDGDEPAVA